MAPSVADRPPCSQVLIQWHRVQHWDVARTAHGAGLAVDPGVQRFERDAGRRAGIVAGARARARARDPQRCSVEHGRGDVGGHHFGGVAAHLRQAGSIGAVAGRHEQHAQARVEHARGVQACGQPVAVFEVGVMRGQRYQRQVGGQQGGQVTALGADGGDDHGRISVVRDRRAMGPVYAARRKRSQKSGPSGIYGRYLLR